ncbi:unnamed protein product [Peniophora sp. CBMAI 1063]|nr:unnamed protein product [Peniophora sp. CBMAI 1063]
MPTANRRLRSCLTAPMRAERAFRRVLSSAFLRLSKAIAPGAPYRSRSPRSSAPPSPGSAAPQLQVLAGSSASSYTTRSTASTSARHIPPTIHPTWPYPSSYGSQTTPFAPVDLRTWTPPPYPAPSIPYAHELDDPRASLRTHGPYALHTLGQPHAPTFAAAHDAPPLLPPTYTSHSDYDMTLQDAFPALSSSSQDSLQDPTTFRSPASTTVTPQQHAFALQAFVPSPTQRRLRAPTPPTISPRVLLGEMGVDVFINPDEIEGPLGATRTPRGSPRVSPYARHSPQSRRVPARRAMSLPESTGGEDAAGSVAVPLNQSDAYGSPPPVPIRETVDLSGTPSGEEFNAHYELQEHDVASAASTWLRSPLRETSASGGVTTVNEPMAPPAPPTRSIVDLPDTPTDRHFEVQEEAESVGDQEGGALQFIPVDDADGQDDDMLDQSLISVGSDELAAFGDSTSLHAQDGVNVAEEDGSYATEVPDAQDNYIHVDDLHALADSIHMPLPEHSTAADTLGAFGHTVAGLQDGLGDAYYCVTSVQRDLQRLQDGGLDAPSLQQALGPIISRLKNAATKVNGRHSHLIRDPATVIV